MLVGVGEIFVRLKVAVDVVEGAVATTLYEPPKPFAVNGGETASPLSSEFTVFDWLNVPLGPLLGGGVNVTGTPKIPNPEELVTRTTRGEENVVFTFALCGEPANTERVACVIVNV